MIDHNGVLFVVFITQAHHTVEAIQLCSTVLETDPNNVDALIDRAEAYLQDERWEEAINEFQRAKDLEENSQRTQDGLNRAQKLFKQSQKRDYYKILGVKRYAESSTWSCIVNPNTSGLY